MKELRAMLRLGACTVLPLILFALILARLRSLPPEPGRDTPAPSAVRVSEEPETAAPEPQDPLPFSPDRERRVRLITPEGTVDLTMAEYLPGVIAAEMPASFPAEALKAQAVAARTDTVWRQAGRSPHPEGACCSDPGCCKAWLSEAELRTRWGEDYDRFSALVREAAEATDGLVLLYGGEPIFAAFHACSPGRTEASENVWIEALPYLRSVTSPETPDTVPDFTSAVRLSYDELRQTAAEKYPGLVLTGPGETWLTEAQYSDSGRLLTVKLGNTLLTGTQLRFLLGLRSTAVTWACGDGEIRFEARGYGHGVGMSQYGARQMALEGADCWTILAHYYPGTTVGNMPNP